MFDFTNFYNDDGSINLKECLAAMYEGHASYNGWRRAKEYVESVERIRPVTSRQLAAVVIATAIDMAKNTR